MKAIYAVPSRTAAFLFLALGGLQAFAQTELIVNGGFESGTANWVMTGGAGVYADGFARSGAGYVWLGGAESEVDAAYQTVSIPNTASNATLSFYYNISSFEGTSTPYDIFTVTVRNTSGGVLATVGNWSNVNQDPGAGNPYYHQQTFNMLPYAGQTVRVYFGSANDSSLVTSFLVDDVSVQVNVPTIRPTNDTCSAAIAMTAGTTYILNTANATATGDPTPGCQGSFGKGVWYTYTPSASGTVTISTCGSTFDTVLAVYTGSCGSLTPLACNDDNGPACASSQASLSFSATSGTTYYVLAGGSGGGSGTLNILATGPGGLKILPTFASSITSDAQAATIEATINAAIAVYQSTYSELATVTITFEEMGSGVGQSSTFYTTYSYADYCAALASHATTGDDATAVAHLPNQVANPVNGSSSTDLTLPLARTLGFSGADTPPGQTDGTIYLNTSIMNLSLNSTNPSKYSLFSTACHEIDEVLGMGSALNGLNNGDPSPTGAIGPMDLFRYDGSGARSFNTSVNTACYFSLDGTFDLVRFNQHQGGDFQDFYSYGGGQTPRVQDAYSTAGTQPTPNVELTILDAIGYTRAGTARPTLSVTRAGTNVVIAWPNSFPGFTLQCVTNITSTNWSSVTNAQYLANGNYNVTNALAGSGRFYRLIK